MNKYRQKITQEEFEQIENYLLGTLPEARLIEFESRMEKDDQLRDEVELQRKLMTAVELGAVGEFFQKPKNNTGKVPLIPLRKIWLYAAGLVLILLGSYIAWSLLQDEALKTAPELYSAYFYPDPGLPVVMSSEGEYDFYDGMVSYKQGEYDEAATVWSKLPKQQIESDTLQYYLGMASLNAGELVKASTYLDGIISGKQSSWSEKAKWYRALIYLRENNSASAIELLESLPNDVRATKLLKELNQIPSE